MNMFTKSFKLIIIILFSIIVSACANNQGAVNGQDQLTLWKNHQNELKTITAFQVNGSLAYFSENSRYYGRFFINQSAPNEYQLKLTTPVGNSIFSLMVTPYLAELTDSDGNKHRDENVERLVKRLVNMDIPLKELNSWLIGFSDDSTNDKIDTSGRLVKTKLSQQNQTWNVIISKYTTAKYANKRIELPTTIELSKKQDKLRLTINSWKLN